MGRRGPPPKPTAAKKLAGNPGKRKLNDAEPQFAATIPSCPSWLPPLARVEWQRVVPELAPLGLLTLVDCAALACYCLAWSDLQEAVRQIHEEGRTFQTESGYTCKHPAVTMAAEASQRLKSFAAEFGFTPSSRSRVKVPSKDATDPTDEFFSTPPPAQSAPTKRGRKGKA